MLRVARAKEFVNFYRTYSQYCSAGSPSILQPASSEMTSVSALRWDTCCLLLVLPMKDAVKCAIRMCITFHRTWIRMLAHLQETKRLGTIQVGSVEYFFFFEKGNEIMAHQCMLQICINTTGMRDAHTTSSRLSLVCSTKTESAVFCAHGHSITGANAA